MVPRDEPASGGDDTAGLAHLAVSAPARVSRRRAAAVLGADREAWLGEVVGGGVTSGDQDRYLVDFELRVTEHAPRIAFRKAAYVDVGPLQGAGKGPMSLGISWRAAGLAPLFPVFAGTLRWADGELQLSGVYAPPGGGIGLMADRLLLNVAARATARWLLGRIAAVMRGEAV